MNLHPARQRERPGTSRCYRILAYRKTRRCPVRRARCRCYRDGRRTR